METALGTVVVVAVSLALADFRQNNCFPVLVQMNETDFVLLTAPALGHLVPAVASTVDIGRSSRQQAIVTIFRITTSYTKEKPRPVSRAGPSYSETNSAREDVLVKRGVCTGRTVSDDAEGGSCWLTGFDELVWSTKTIKVDVGSGLNE